MHAEAMGKILNAGSGGKGSAEGQSFQPIQANFVVSTLPTLSMYPRACFSLSLSLSPSPPSLCLHVYDYLYESGVSQQSTILIGNKGDIVQFAAHQKVPLAIVAMATCMRVTILSTRVCACVCPVRSASATNPARPHQ